MLILGFLSIMQIVLIPGYIFLRCMRITGGILKTILLSFALSLTINHFAVVLLTSFKIYTQASVLMLLLVETIFLIYISWPVLKQPLSTVVKRVVIGDKQFGTSYFQSPDSSMILINVLYLVAVVAIVVLLVIVIKTFVPVFNLWDDVVSWNRWAIDWYRGRYPSNTMYYPQLIPSNWSISYVLLNTSQVQLFAKSIMPLFSLAMLFTMIDLWHRTRELTYLYAVPYTGFFLLLIGKHESLTSGYVDIPVAFMAFVPLYCLLLAEKASSFQETRSYLLIGAICCAGGALTKQAGLFVMAAYPFLCHMVVLRPLSVIGTKEKWRLVFKLVGVMLLLVIPWYVYTTVMIRCGQDHSAIYQVVVGAHQGRSFVQRIGYAVNLLQESCMAVLGIAVWRDTLTQHKAILLDILLVALFVPVVAGIKDRTARIVLAAIVLPYSIVWSMLYSYDLRNLSLAIPFMGWLSGKGLQSCSASLLPVLCRKAASVRLLTVIVVVIPLILIGSARYDNKELLQRQLFLQKQIGDPGLNNYLYSYQQQPGFKGEILTNYHLMKFLPGLDKYYRSVGLCELKPFAKRLDSPSVQYLLVILGDMNRTTEVTNYIEQKIRTGQLERLTAVDGVLFAQVKRSQP